MSNYQTVFYRFCHHAAILQYFYTFFMQTYRAFPGTTVHCVHVCISQKMLRS